ncbi:hypothetical protein ACFLY6_00195 [Candidatus Dependentiae bacterium]
MMMEIKWLEERFPVAASAFLFLLIAGSMVWVFYARTWDQARLINRDIRKIASILEDIDKSCAITDVQRTRVPVDFLTIKSFVGSEVGNINLAYPKNWRGPYVRDNPSIGGNIFYDIVKLKEGYCVVPGFGATLPNGLTVGKDIKLSRRVSIKKIISPGGSLFYKGTPMGAFLNFPIGDWRVTKEPKKRGLSSKVKKLLDDFNQAIMFSMNDVAETTNSQKA